MAMQQKNAICLIGTLVSEEWFNCLNRKSLIKTSGSPIYMQEHIYKSIIREDTKVTAFSYPPIASFPRSKLIFTVPRKQKVRDDLPVYVIPIINIVLLKQITVFLSMLFYLGCWSFKNIFAKRTILVYADFLEYGFPAVLISKLFRSKSVLFLTEMPGYEHYLKRKASVKDKLIIASEKLKKSLHKLFDGYIFISKKLEEAINLNNRVFAVVEGFADDNIFKNISVTEKNEKFTFMYAGSLGDQYNIPALIEGFSMVEKDCLLWIFGAGSNAEYVINASRKDKRICYFGSVSRTQVLQAEKKAHILLHTKTDKDEFTKYCFSSKIVEYMLSGTPVMTTKVDGIPDEYYSYAFIVPEAKPETIAETMKIVLDVPNEDIKKVGKDAHDFVVMQKSVERQGDKILNVISELHKNEKHKSYFQK